MHVEEGTRCKVCGKEQNQPHSPRAGRGATIIELGAGTGLASLVAARCTHQPVYCTDTGVDVLRNAMVNAEQNGVAVEVRALDWTAHATWPWDARDAATAQGLNAVSKITDSRKSGAVVDEVGEETEASDNEKMFAWTDEERRGLSERPLVLLAADGE
jgi:ribosomal protein L11 methylase PrmA